MRVRPSTGRTEGKRTQFVHIGILCMCVYMYLTVCLIIYLILTCIINTKNVILEFKVHEDSEILSSLYTNT